MLLAFLCCPATCEGVCFKTNPKPWFPFICIVKKWTGFYIIGTSVMKELMSNSQNTSGGLFLSLFLGLFTKWEPSKQEDVQFTK